MMNSADICAHCTWWSPGERSTNPAHVHLRGQCRRHAPQSAAIDGQLRSFWPLTFEDQWCGKFEGRG